MLDGRKFDPFEMTGKTDEDCKKIKKMLEIEADLYVDKHMRVVADSVLYVADAIEVGPGKGIIYRKDNSKMYELFDADTMTGQTKRDKIAILAALESNKTLYINDKFQIINEAGQHIANGFVMLPGHGIAHEE